MSDDGYGISWRAAFRCDDEPSWLAQQTDTVVDELARTALWTELQVFGSSGSRGRPFKGVAAVKKALRDGQIITLARGDEGATVRRTSSPARATIETQAGALTLTAHVRGESLARLGALALTEYSEMLVELIRRWRPHARLAEAWAFPIDHPRSFTYPRLRPPRVTSPFRNLNAIVDVLDPTFTETPRNRANLVATRAMAIAELPPGVVRSEHDAVVVQRWVEDPRDRAAVEAACTRHECWLTSLLPTKTAPGWTEDGDQLLGGYSRPATPPVALLLHDNRDDQDLYFAHIAIEATEDGDVDPAAWETIAPLAKVRSLPNGAALDEVRLLAPSRAAALALRERARSAGFDRVVYQKQSRGVWDPDPPGPWVE